MDLSIFFPYSFSFRIGFHGERKREGDSKIEVVTDTVRVPSAENGYCRLSSVESTWLSSRYRKELSWVAYFLNNFEYFFSTVRLPTRTRIYKSLI